MILRDFSGLSRKGDQKEKEKKNKQEADDDLIILVQNLLPQVSTLLGLLAISLVIVEI